MIPAGAGGQPVPPSVPVFASPPPSGAGASPGPRSAGAVSGGPTSVLVSVLVPVSVLLPVSVFVPVSVPVSLPVALSGLPVSVDDGTSVAGASGGLALSPAEPLSTPPSAGARDTEPQAASNNEATSTQPSAPADLRFIDGDSGGDEDRGRGPAPSTKKPGAEYPRRSGPSSGARASRQCSPARRTLRAVARSAAVAAAAAGTLGWHALVAHAASGRARGRVANAGAADAAAAVGAGCASAALTGPHRRAAVRRRAVAGHAGSAP